MQNRLFSVDPRTPFLGCYFGFVKGFICPSGSAESYSFLATFKQVYSRFELQCRTPCFGPV
jgi:hypothetical protein